MSESPVIDFIKTYPVSTISKKMEALHKLIVQTIPNINYSIKWKVPCYGSDGLICYFNPKKDKIMLGFMRGTLLSNEQGVLTGDGKLVRHVVIGINDTIPQQAIKEILVESLMINQWRINNKG